MKYRIIPIFLILIVGTFVFSCATNQGDQTSGVDTNAVRTEAVATFASSLTQILPASAMPSATPTIELTGTPIALSTTPEPSATTNPCYNLLYIDDVTIPDGTHMKAGETFTKTWEVQNIGGCAWRTGFTFQNVGGETMRGNTVVLTEAVPTGAKRKISVDMVVPSGINGLIQSSWRMADETGNFFGDTLSVNIVVGNITTPAVTSTP